MKESHSDELKLDEGALVPFPGPGFHDIQRSVMPLVTIADGKLVPLGTAFAIGPSGILLTAKHVVNHAKSFRTRKVGSNGKWYDHWELYALYMTNEPNDDGTTYVGGLIGIDAVWDLDEIDIACCILQAGTRDGVPLQFPVSQLTTDPPRTGEHVLGLGYHTMRGGEAVLGASEKYDVNYDQHTAFAHGRVEEVHIVRGPSINAFPCFQTNARFDPGMSGGPVFNERGHVCGVITCGWKDLDRDGFTSTASLLYPALALNGELVVDDEKRVWTLHELASKNAIRVEHLDRIQIARGASAEKWELRFIVPKGDEPSPRT